MLDRARQALAYNHLDEAEEALNCIQADQRKIEVALLRASLAAKRGRLTDAASVLRQCLATESWSSEVASALAWICIQRNQPGEALQLLDLVIARNPGDLRAASHRAWLALQLGRADEAIANYRELVRRQPGSVALKVSLGQTLIAAGHDKQAISLFRDALILDPGAGDAWWALANSRAYRFGTADIAMMRTLLAEASLSDRQRLPVHFALGRALESQGAFEAAFHQYLAGNQIQSHGAQEAGKRTRCFVERSVELFTRKFMSARAAQGHCDRSPIFIVGMPRSGSTLLEQMLSSHSQVEGTSELPNIDAIALSLSEDSGANNGEYLERLGAMSAAGLRELGETYIEQAAPYRRTQRPFFIDKMPSNWQHLVLIRLILPKARIIHIRREALDCCFANFAQYFPRGHEFSTSLEELGSHYRLHERMISHIEDISPGAVLSVSYEELVQEPERELRRVFGAIGLQFEENCLRFYESNRPVLTPSSHQVRQPLNRSGIGRWKNFEPWLEPLKGALGDGRGGGD